MIHFSVHAKCDYCDTRFRFKGDTLEICWSKFWKSRWDKSGGKVACPRCFTKVRTVLVQTSTGGAQ